MEPVEITEVQEQVRLLLLEGFQKSIETIILGLQTEDVDTLNLGYLAIESLRNVPNGFWF
jgi:hypothetical protein